LLPLLSAFNLALPECQFLLDGLVGHQLGLNGWQKLTFKATLIIQRRRTLENQLNNDFLHELKAAHRRCSLDGSRDMALRLADSRDVDIYIISITG